MASLPKQDFRLWRSQRDILRSGGCAREAAGTLPAFAAAGLSPARHTAPCSALQELRPYLAVQHQDLAHWKLPQLLHALLA